jgi:hypothetical protein
LGGAGDGEGLEAPGAGAAAGKELEGA